MEIAGFTLITIAMTLGPLAPFFRKLVRCQQGGQLDYGRCQPPQPAVRRSLAGGAGGEPLGDPSISSLADLGTELRMRSTACARCRSADSSLATILLVCAAPALPALLAVCRCRRRSCGS